MIPLSGDIHQYSEQFLKKLHDKYSDPNKVKSLLKYGNQYVLDFAKHWPCK